ncbi:GCFC-domain-containing protein [Anaeromyces robustus]|uniref:GCFC-domain-containing protein n=1 Tax=Anaeromyces robustus TaxID=1754192 RepID=A0A1Y1WTH7_9FUNG|nr:GCFC-domain-containing protein [Anaeromyces robustus]|eukprot:ORX76833.1 GCFC-domain-containing protein [Anaeromyces robustus]
MSEEIVFKKSSKKKSLRKKNINIPIEDEEIDDSPVLNINKIKKKDKKKKALNKKIELSFNEPEEEEDVFKIKKSSASLRLTKAKLNKNVYHDDLENTKEEFSPYSEKNLNALKNSSLNRPPPSNIIKKSQEIYKNINKPNNGIEEIKIPDATKIHEAKKLREARRNARNSSANFIPLDSNDTTMEDKKENDDDDDDDEVFEDYENNRILFGTNAVKEQESRRKKEMKVDLINAQENESEEEDKDELNKWESELIKQGRAAPEIMKVAKKKSEMAKNQIPENCDIPSLDEVMRGFAASLYQMELKHSEDVNEEAYLVEEIDKSKKNTENLQSDLQLSSDKYTYFQELRNYIIDLAEFLDEKFKDFNKINEDYLNLKKEKELFISNRIQSDLNDCFYDFVTGWNGLVFDSEGNNIYKYDLEQKENREMLRKLRTKSQINKINKSKNNKTITSIEDMEGYISNDDFDDKDQEVYDTKKAEILQKYYEFFNDTNENFKDLSIVKKNFEDWKEKYAKEYNQGFGGLSMPGVFELFVKYELFLWEPLEKYREFEDMVWHQEASTYGTSNMMELDNYDPDDDDNKLLIRIVEKFAIPKVKEFIKLWNVFSINQTRNLLRILILLQDYIKAKDTIFIGVIEEIENKFKSSIEKIISHNPIQRVTPQKNISLHHYDQINYWFWKIFKVYNNLFLFEKYISKDSLQEMTINLLLNQLLVPCLDIIRDCYLNSTIYPTLFQEHEKEELLKFEKLCYVIPEKWYNEEYSVPSYFKSLETSLKEFSKLCQNQKSSRNVFEIIVKLLVKLRSYDEASKLGKIYKIE